MITKITVDKYHKDINKYFEGTKDIISYWICDKTSVSYGVSNDCNLSYCEEHNIPVFKDRRRAGCLVSTKGNIVIALNLPFDGKTYTVNIFLKEFVEYLKSKGLNAKFERNDVLVDGFKVASGVGQNLKPDFKRQYTGIQISINQDMEVIKNACKKKMIKVPKGLSEYNITTEEIENWVINYFNK